MVASKPVNRCPVKGCTAVPEKTLNHERTGLSEWRYKCPSSDHQEYWFYGICWCCKRNDVSYKKCDCDWYICRNRNCDACHKEGCSRNNYGTIIDFYNKKVIKPDEEVRGWLKENMPKLKDPLYAKEHEKIIKDRSLYLYTYNGHMKFPEIGGVLGKTLDKEKYIEP